MRIVMVVADPDAVFARGVKAGATVVLPVEDKEYGWRVGRIADPFGHHWENRQALGRRLTRWLSRRELAVIFKVTWELVGGPGVEPGFAASDAAVLFSYTTHPSGTRATQISSSCLRPHEPN